MTKHTYRVAFDRGDPMAPNSLAEQLELARSWARKNSVPNAEDTPRYKVKKRRTIIEWTWVDDEPGSWRESSHADVELD